MNKLRIFIFLFFAAILFSACKSVPQAPADEFPIAESPDVFSASEEISVPEKISPAEEISAPEKMPPAENPPTSEGAPTPEEASLSAGTALSQPAAQTEPVPQNAGMDEEDLPPEKPKTALSLKPKTSVVDSGKTAVPKENTEKLLPVRPQLKPRLAPRLAPVNTVHSESSADSSAADAMPVASETAALSPVSDSEVQVSAAAVKVQDKIEPKTEPADNSDLSDKSDKSELQSVVSPERIQNIAETVAVPASSSVKPSENASSSSVFDEPEIVLHADDFTAAESNAQENRDEVLIEPSRVEEAELNQSFNILYEGKNWIFLGEKNPVQPPVVEFLKRSFNGNNTVFSLNALSEGETVLHFYKHDLLENTARDEYVLVKVKAVKPQTDSETSSASSSEVQTVTDTPLAESDTQTEAASSPKEVYAQAETAFNETRYADALNILDDFFQNFTPSDNCFDKAVFLKARIYETPSEYRNIRGALDEYKKITAFFPESDLWEDARRRITYINRFYMDIR